MNWPRCLPSGATPTVCRAAMPKFSTPDSLPVDRHVEFPQFFVCLFVKILFNFHWFMYIAFSLFVASAAASFFAFSQSV